MPLWLDLGFRFVFAFLGAIALVALFLGALSAFFALFGDERRGEVRFGFELLFVARRLLLFALWPAVFFAFVLVGFFAMGRLTGSG